MRPGSEGLAPYVVRRLEGLIADINHQQGVTVLFVEQNVAATIAVADRHYLLDGGHIVAEATTGQLRDDEHLRQTDLGV